MPKNNSDFEIKFYEDLLKKKEDFVEALIALGELYTNKGLYEKGLRVDEKLVSLKPNDPIVFYNLSCSYSLMNRIDDALDAMKKALLFGYEDLLHLENDVDLENLKKDQRFVDYFSQIKNTKG